MTIHAGLFEAKSIQEYLFQSGRLRHVIGASELVDSLTRALLREALEALGPKTGEAIRFTRCAGGAFYAFCEEGAILERFLALWTLLVQHYAPGLAYDLGRGEGATVSAAFDAARAALRADASRHRPPLPTAAPVAERSRRTGLVAVATGEKTEDGPVDAATHAKEQINRKNRSGFLERFSPPGVAPDAWPLDLEPGAERAFPYRGDDRTVALIHADGNGLGQLLMNAREAVKEQPSDRFIEVFTAISQGIDESTRAAAREAVRRVLLPNQSEEGLLPARPILLGGDDLTLLVRADLALPFLSAFAAAFEDGSHCVMEQLAGLGVGNLPSRLTVGAGIVYLRASQPFYLASSLAESLTESAKRLAKRVDRENPPTAVAFHRVTATLVDSYDAIRERERTYNHGGRAYTATLDAYLLGPVQQAPHLEDLLALQRLLGSQEMARGPARQLLTLLGFSHEQAKTRYRRWRYLMKDNREEQLKEFDRLMKKLLPRYQAHSDLPFAASDDEYQWVTPLGDVLGLMAVGNSLATEQADQGNGR